MTFDFEYILIICLSVIYFMLPAYMSNISGLAFGGSRPLDFNKNFFDNRRIIGDGVTIKGLIAGTIIGTLTGMLLGYFPLDFLGSYTHGLISPAYTSLENGTMLGFLLGFGALLGDAVGSFIKRRLKIDRGHPAPLLDQLDFVIGALVLGSLVLNFSITFILVACVMTLILHLLTNIIAYLLGMKDVWY